MSVTVYPIREPRLVLQFSQSEMNIVIFHESGYFLFQCKRFCWHILYVLCVCACLCVCVCACMLVCVCACVILVCFQIMLGVFWLTYSTWVLPKLLWTGWSMRLLPSSMRYPQKWVFQHAHSRYSSESFIFYVLVASLLFCKNQHTRNPSSRHLKANRHIIHIQLKVIGGCCCFLGGSSWVSKLYICCYNQHCSLMKCIGAQWCSLVQWECCCYLVWYLYLVFYNHQLKLMTFSNLLAKGSVLVCHSWGSLSSAAQNT